MTQNSGSYIKEIEEQIGELEKIINGSNQSVQKSTEFFKSTILKSFGFNNEDDYFFVFGKENGKIFSNPLIGKDAIEKYFDCLNSAYDIIVESIEKKHKSLEKKRDFITEELETLESKLDEQDPSSDLFKEKQRLGEINKQIDSLVENDHFLNIEKTYLQYIDSFQRSLYATTDQVENNSDSDLVISARKELVKEMKEVLAAKDTEWKEKVAELKEKISQCNEIVSEVKKSESLANSYFDEALERQKGINLKVKEQFESNKNSLKGLDVRVGSKFQMGLTLLFFFIALIGEIYVVENISAETLYLREGVWTRWAFIIGYPIAIGLIVKFLIQYSDNKRAMKRRISYFLTFFAILGITSLSLINADWNARPNGNNIYNDDNPFGEISETNSSLSIQKQKQTYRYKALTYLSLSLLFGGISGLTFVSFFKQYENYINLKKVTPFFSGGNSYNLRLQRRKEEIKSKIDKLYQDKHQLKEALVKIEMMISEEAESGQSNFKAWLEQMKEASIGSFYSGYELGKAEKSHDSDEIFIQEIIAKKRNN